MIIAAGFTLLKLLNSFFADSGKLAHGRDLFLKTIKAIRTISVATNDLPSRLAEVLAQLWKSGGSGLRAGQGQTKSLENSLQLKVRCRMSMSLVYDSVWRWREEFQAKERGNLESKPSVLLMKGDVCNNNLSCCEESNQSRFERRELGKFYNRQRSAIRRSLRRWLWYRLEHFLW